MEIKGKDGSGLGGRGRQTLWERQATDLGARLNVEYEAHRFDIPGLADKVSIRTIVTHLTSCSCARTSGAFGVITRAGQVSIRNDSDVEIDVRFNAATSDRVPVRSGEDLYWTFVETEDLFFSNPNSASPKTVIVALA